MKKFTPYLIGILSLSIGNMFAQTGNIRFTAKKNPAQENQVFIYGKNFSGSLISGVIGASNITLCVTFPSTLTGNAIISSPIAGQTFDVALKNRSGADSVYTWNGTGSTAIIDFPGGGVTEVHLATVSFKGSGPGMTATVKIANLAGAGPSGFDYCYIAPGGNEHSGYTTPFYSNIVSDPLLINGGGANDPLGANNSSLGISNVVLPVKFLAFSAVKKGGNALLTWQIENESAITDRYEVERSLNGLDYVKFATVLPKNNGQSGNSYDLSDLNISSLRSSGVFYYRIKQVDKDGKFIYSEIKNLRLNSKGLAIGVYPNPVRSFANLTIDIEQDTDATVSITDASGKQVQLLQMQLFKGPNIKKIKMDNLATGSYMLKVQTATEIKTMAVVKAN